MMAKTPSIVPAWRLPPTLRSTSSTSRSLASRAMNAETYRLLTLVRDFDDRFGFAKWGFRPARTGSRGAADVAVRGAREGAQRAGAS